MKNRRIYLGCLILVLFAVFGCKQNLEKHANLEQHVSEIARINTSIEGNDWTVSQLYESAGQTIDTKSHNYVITRTDGDTTLLTSFVYFLSEKQDPYFVDDLIKYYEDDSLFYEFALFSKDTLYYFYCDKQMVEDQEDRVCRFDYEGFTFIVGKYYFLRKYCLMSAERMDYFDQNSDSLTRVRGTNLPELPELVLESN